MYLTIAKTAMPIENLLASKVKDVPVWEKNNLTIDEAATVFNIGEHKLRELTESEDCPYVLWVGRKRLIKKDLFQAYLDKTYSI